MKYFVSFVYYRADGIRDFGNGVTTANIANENDLRQLEKELLEEVKRVVNKRDPKIIKLLICSLQPL